VARDTVAVAVVVFDRAPMFETSVPVSVFGVEHSERDAPKFRLLVVAGEDGPLTTTGGLIVEAPFGLDALQEASIVVLPSWRDISERPPEPALAAIRAAHANGSIIVSFCLGGFVLAATGLLDGRRAVMHWFYAPALAAMYPRVSVDHDALYSDDGDLVTGAGTGAALDACLQLVRRLWGAKAASSIARGMTMPPGRIGTRAQLIDSPPMTSGSSQTFAEVLAFAVERIAEPFDVDELANRALMSRRTFDRHFREHAGISAVQWLLQQRIIRAQRLLEDTGESVEDIARSAGFRNAVALRRHFRRHLGVSPRQYRMQCHADRATNSIIRHRPHECADASAVTGSDHRWLAGVAESDR
jgi:transcriptional regulator GlxA family with amidase domain